MKVSDVHYLCNKPLKEEEIIPILDIDNDKRLDYNIPDNKEIERICNKFNIDVKHIFFNQEHSFSPVFYYKDTVYVPIELFNEDFIENFYIAKRIEEQTKKHKEWIENKNFNMLFSLIDRQISFIAYKKLFDKIPDNDKFDIFIDIYIDSEYGFGDFLELDFVKEVIKYKKDNNEELIDKLNPVNGYVTIYRGEGTKSTPIDRAYSWTTNLNTALFFANRFYQSKGSKIFKAKVHIDDIIAYIEDRDEDEVLVLYEDLKDVENIELLDVTDVADAEIINSYHYYVGKIKPAYFHNPSGIHGVLHTKRVLFLTLILSKLHELNETESQILSEAAIYHDIGRTNDDIDYEHGRLSYEKIEDLDLVDEDYAYIEILRYVVTEHAVPDEIAFNNIKNYDIRDKENAIKLLKIFKDADGLDRVRLGDLDISYLRTEYGVKLAGVAKQVLAGIK